MAHVGEIKRDIEKPHASDLGDFTKGIRFARVVDVYDASILSASSKEQDKYGKVSVIFLDGSSKPPVLLAVLRPWFSWTRGSGIMFMPEQNDIVACMTQANGYPVVVGFLPYKWNNTLNKIVPSDDMSFGDTKPLYKGEVLIKGSSGSSVLLDRMGTVTIEGTDSTIADTVVTNIDDFNKEFTYDRTKPFTDSGISKAVFGNAYHLDGSVKHIGNYPQIFECGTSVHGTLTLDLPFTSEVNFTLPSDTEITKIISVELQSVASGKVLKSMDLRDYQYDLTFTNVYPYGDTSQQNKNHRPATLDKNLIGYTLVLKGSILGGSWSSVRLTANTEKFAGGIRVNNAGDVFIDGRNVVVRAENEMSSLLLKDNGTANMTGVNVTSIGSENGGKISCYQGGIEYSTGILNNGNTPAIQSPLTATISSDEGNIQYFYVSDQLPMIKLFQKSDGEWVYDAVTKEEYQSMSPASKVNVKKIWFSKFVKFLTEEKMIALMGQEIPSYGELKRAG